jgi:hypothetical protein
VTEAARDNMERETWISSSFEHDDIKKYLQEVLQEVKCRRDRKDSNYRV